MRTNQWLAEKLDELHRQYFSDITIPNTILVRFGRKSRQRFGSIISRPRSGYAQNVTYITINALFRTEEVPEYVVQATLAHEFVHYLHGFHSPHRRLFMHPHRGDIVNKELRHRGLGSILEQQETWIKNQYREFLKQNHP